MVATTPSSTGTDTLFPYTTLFRSAPSACLRDAPSQMSQAIVPEIGLVVIHEHGHAPVARCALFAFMLLDNGIESARIRGNFCFQFVQVEPGAAYGLL